MGLEPLLKTSQPDCKSSVFNRQSSIINPIGVRLFIFLVIIIFCLKGEAVSL